VWSWRLRRVIRYETGQIAGALAEHSDDLQQSREADPEPDSVASSNPEMDAMTDHLFLTSEGLENQMRYEAMINKMLNRAIAELERIQTPSKEAALFAKQSQEVLYFHQGSENKAKFCPRCKGRTRLGRGDRSKKRVSAASST